MASESPHPLPKGVFALGLVSFLSDVASDMIYPLLPDFLTRTLHAGPAALGLIEGLTKVFYPEASSIVVFVIMAIVLMVRPAGLFGRA